MVKKNWKLILIGFLVVMLSVSLMLGCEEEPAEDPDADEVEEDPDRMSIRWNTADVGSYGYSVASMMVDFLNRELPEEYTVTVHPFPATSAAMRAAKDGDGDISYTADVGMRPAYDREDPYEDLDPEVGDLVHSFYAYPMETFLTVLEDNADNYDSWSDFDGEPVFFSPAGYMNWMNMQRIFDALDIEFNHEEIDSGMTHDALRDGTIEGAASYTTAGQSLPTWWEEAQLQVDIAVINPSDDELDTLAEQGLTPTEIDPGVFDAQDDVGVDTILGIPILFGYNVRADADPDFVYEKLNIFYENRDELAELDPGFEPLADDFVGMQVQGIEVNPDIPVHQGLADFLEDQDAWNDDWEVAE